MFSFVAFIAVFLSALASINQNKLPKNYPKGKHGLLLMQQVSK